MNNQQRPNSRLLATLLLAAAAMTAAGCTGSDSTTDASAAAAVSAAAGPSTTVATIDPPDSTAQRTDPPATTAPATDPPDAPATTVDESWRDDTSAWCDEAGEGFLAIAPPASPDDVARYIGDWVALRDSSSSSTSPEWPPELNDEPYDLDGLREKADRWIDRAVEQLAAGTVDGPEFSDTALGSVDYYRYLLQQTATNLAIAGVTCGLADPMRMAKADLNVPVFNAYQLETGFGSVWVSSTANRAVHRIDPDSGTQLAMIDVGSAPFKLQPADGRMIVRTADAYVAIDPTTDSVTDTLAKTDVGPAADRSWAVDGAMWICDGQRLHRYDPATFEPVTTIELGFDCGQVHATEELVIAWSYNQDDGESGTSTAAFIDPATNQVHTTIDLPVDVGVPIVLDDQIYFPPYGSGPPLVVDRANWSVTSTPHLGAESRASQSAYDGTSIYVITGDAIAVVDPSTYEVTETIDAFNFDAPAPLRVTSVAVSPGALWVVNADAGVLQRFDRPT